MLRDRVPRKDTRPPRCSNVFSLLRFAASNKIGNQTRTNDEVRAFEEGNNVSRWETESETLLKKKKTTPITRPSSTFPVERLTRRVELRGVAGPPAAIYDAIRS